MNSDGLFYFIYYKEIYNMDTATDGDKAWYLQGSVPDNVNSGGLSMVMIQDNHLVVTGMGYTDVIPTTLYAHRRPRQSYPLNLHHVIKHRTRNKAAFH